MICTIALILLIPVYIVIEKAPEKTGRQEPESYNILEGLEPVFVEVENSYGKYSLEYDGYEWKLDGEGIGGGYCGRLSGIVSEKKIASSDPDAFGLANPLSKVRLTGKNGETKTLLIGDQLSDKSGRYVMTDGIYVVSDQDVAWLLEDKYILKNKVLYIGTSPEKIEFNGICLEIVDGIWQMTSPYRHQLKENELSTEVLANLRFEAVDFTDKAPYECGLDPPKGYISVWDSEKKTTIYLGDKENGLIYAMLEGGNDVYRIEVPPFIERKPIFFLNTLCYVKNIDEIDSINVNGITFDISDGYKKDGKDIKKEAFIGFYKQLMGMMLIDEAEDPVKDEPILKMEVNFKNGKTDTVEVYRYRERYGAVFINGKCTFYTLAESAEKIVLQAQKL